MYPVARVRDFLLDKVGHMTYPGTASFDPTSERWLVPIFCRTDQGSRVVGDVEVDRDGHIVFATGKEELNARLGVQVQAAPAGS